MIGHIRQISKKLVALGPRKTAQIISKRLQTAWADRTIRAKAQKGQLSHSWHDIAAKHVLPTEFSTFWHLQSQRSLSYLADLVPKEGTTAAADAIVIADAAANKTFDLLGSGSFSFKNIPWHVDMRLYQQLLREGISELAAMQRATFNARLFYKDIPIEVGATDSLEKDIKGPWELSRFYHAGALSHAYHITGNKKYTQAFVEHVSDWLDNNPYMLGPNWVCPMEVGIRALNLVYAICYMRSDQEIPLPFWERLTVSLYDHMEYLENNWEIYDGITNNHYMSDLVGYLSLCWFFNTQAPAAEFEHEVKKQVFADGTDYESTTSYHRLVTELVYHGWKLCEALGHEAEASRVQPQLYGMMIASRWFADIKIGDDDSGRVLYHGLTEDMINKVLIGETATQGIRHYPSFGLSLAVQASWRVSLRHHARRKNQPASHMHNDAGSITVATQRPLIIDPGSYVYTPSETWRNYFRSIANHNSFYIKGYEPVPLDEGIFSLAVPENKVTWLVPNTNGLPAPLISHHSLYARFGLKAHRALVVEDDGIEIHDWWSSLHTDHPDGLITQWNFTLAPDIAVVIRDEWAELFDATSKELIARIGSEQLRFTAHHGWMSPAYGVKKRCMQLRAERPLQVDEDVLIHIVLN